MNTSNSGYIIQKVKYKDTVNFPITKEGFHNLDYYEAWKVSEGKIVYDIDENYDDNYTVGNPYAIQDAIKKSLGLKCEISYESEVYWINSLNPLVKEIDKWKSGAVSLAGKLKSILVSDFSKLNKYKPLFKRDIFKHVVDFNDKNVILKNLEEYFKNRINKGDYKQLSNFFRLEIFNDTDYISVVDDFDIKYKNCLT